LSQNWSAFRHILIFATKILPDFATAKSAYQVLAISYKIGYSAFPDALRRKKESDLLRAGVRSSIGNIYQPVKKLYACMPGEMAVSMAHGARAQTDARRRRGLGTPLLLPFGHALWGERPKKKA
jgi:hypothetical protein